ncbi:MAG TPA: Crp/Fnr family transcriptional regulator [Sphingomonas sp.]|nr:Crp/Fnr family transcriptional regulator [Sphingomonas sp.]
MASNSNDIFGTMIRKLGRLSCFDDSDRAAIRALPYQVRPAPAGTDIVREGEPTTQCTLLLDGFACRHKETSNGRRQIVSFHIPGDMLDVQHILLPRADHNVQAITAATIAWIPQAALRSLAHERPNILEALWRDSLIDASIFREWVLNVGRRDARSRIAHMLCEFAARAAVGLGAPERIKLPMTQEDIADATGLTPIHVNRTLKDLDRSGVIVRKKRDIEITDWPGLQRIADFDPHYLHQAA